MGDRRLQGHHGRGRHLRPAPRRQPGPEAVQVREQEDPQERQPRLELTTCRSRTDRLPRVVTHNYDPTRGPCRNLCALPDAAAEAVLDEIRASGTRAIKPNYQQRRRATEDWLIAERTRKLGTTPLQRPIYFFLGDFADSADRSRPAGLVMPLSAFPADVLTFTYPDSMASLPIATRACHAAHRKDYHGQVFTLAEIEQVVARHGLPGERWKTDAAMTYDRFIEVQVWDDRPIAWILR